MAKKIKKHKPTLRLIMGDDSMFDSVEEIGLQGLLDADDYIDVERYAGIIEKQIKRDEPKEVIMRYKHKVLTEVVAYFRIEGRSELTTKEKMTKALFKHFGKGKKKKDKKKKKNKE